MSRQSSMSYQSDLQLALSHVLWICGTPCSGKTSIAKLIGEKYGFQLYHFDRHEPAHLTRLDPKKHPNLSAFIAMSMDERWVFRSAEEMARNAIASWRERFSMVIEDLLAMPTEPRILAEGPGFFPDCVAPLISHEHQAIWLFPTERMIRGTYQRRDSSWRRQTSDPEKALRNIIGRNILMVKTVLACVEERGLTFLINDGGHQLEEVSMIIEEHFGL